MTDTTTYYAIPDHYTIGRTFTTWKEALREACTMMAEDRCPSRGDRTRVWIDERETSAGRGDYPVKRWVIALTLEHDYAREGR